MPEPDERHDMHDYEEVPFVPLPHGTCPDCEGYGKRRDRDGDMVVCEMCQGAGNVE